jgi:hypothetical protein
MSREKCMHAAPCSIPARHLRHPAQGAHTPARAARHPARGVRPPAQGARHPAQSARHPAQSARHPARGVRHPARGARHRTQGVLHRTQGALHRAQGALHRAQGALHPARDAPHPARGVRHPARGALRWDTECVALPCGHAAVQQGLRSVAVRTCCVATRGALLAAPTRGVATRGALLAAPTRGVATRGALLAAWTRCVATRSAVGCGADALRCNAKSVGLPPASVALQRERAVLPHGREPPEILEGRRNERAVGRRAARAGDTARPVCVERLRRRGARTCSNVLEQGRLPRRSRRLAARFREAFEGGLLSSALT